MDESANEIPIGLCQCGCGERTRVLYGKPHRFIKGHNRYEPLAVRFWRKVDRRGPTECWPWMAARQKRSGYGLIGAERGRSGLAHRAAWEIHNKKKAGTLYVLHHCDNPRCVNPAHLYLGDQSQNMQDMSQRGRSKKGRPSELRGERANGAKLTVSDVISIRTRCAAGESHAKVARDFPVSTGGVQAVVERRTWKHVT